MRWLIVSVLVVLLVVAAVAANLLLRAQADDQRVQDEIAKRLDALRAAGEPLTAADLARIYPDPPPEKDAARFLGPVLAQLRMPKDEILQQVPLFGPIPFPRGSASLDNPVRAIVEQILETNRPALLAAQHVDLDGTWFATGLSKGFTNVSNPPLHPLMDLARLLCLDATLRAERQDGPGAVGSLLRTLQIGKTCRSPVVIRELSGKVTENCACLALERVLNQTALSENELELLASATTDQGGAGIRRILSGERMVGLYIFESYGNMATQLLNRARSPVSYLWTKQTLRRLTSDEDLLRYLEWEDQLLASLQLSTKQQLEWVATNKPPLAHGPKQESIVLQSVMPDLLGLCRHQADALAQMRLARTAVAIELWRRSHNDAPPDTLAALMPGYISTVPLDPFSDEPLRYQKLAHGYQVYSVGPDFQDDGGREKPEDASEGARGDVTFTVER